MKDKLALLKNVAWAGTAGYLEAATGLAAGIIIARTLGPSQYGNYAFAIWLCGILLMTCNHALPSTAMKFIAEARGADRPDVAAALVHRLMRLHAVSSVLVLSAFTAWILFRPIADWQDELPSYLAIALIAIWARAAFWVRSGIAKGFECLAPQSIALGSTAALNIIVIGVMAWRGASTIHFFMAYAVLGVISNLAVTVLLPRYGVRSLDASIPAEMNARFRSHLRLTGVLMLVGLGTAKTVEMSLLKTYATAEVVGYFAIAGSLTKGAIDVLLGGLSAVLLPAMARRVGTGSAESLGRLFSESTRFYFFVGVAIAGLGISVAGELVQDLYGPRFDGAIAALSWLIVIGGLALASAPALALLTATDRQADRIRIVGYSVLFNVVIGVVLVPRYQLNGAIASFGLTTLYQTLLALWYARQSLAAGIPWGALGRIGLAGLLATVGSLSMLQISPPHVAFLTGSVAFLLVYLPLTLIFRVWRAADIEFGIAMLTRMGPTGRRLASGIRLLRRFGAAD